MTVRDIKALGKKVFRANYWNCVIAAVLLALLVGGVATSGAKNAQNAVPPQENASISVSFQNAVSQLTPGQITGIFAAITSVGVVGILLKIFLFNPLKVGCYRFFNKNARDTSVTLSVIKEGFGDYVRTLLTLFLTDLFTFLWGLLFIIPGIIKAYSYRLVPYILRDEPDLPSMEVIRRSKELMRGNKWKAFVMDLSFIGWYLLSVLTAGLLNLFWTNPYRESACAVFYNDLKD